VRQVQEDPLAVSDSHTDARRSAIHLLDQVLGEGKLLSECIAGGALDRLAAPDRARAQRLATETLRGLERADRLLQKHLRKYPPLTVRNALRLGVVELAHGEAAHGVVNAMVQIVGRHKRHGALKGLVNAVLRKCAENTPEAWNALRAPRLPKWLRGPLVQAWGSEAVAAMEQAHLRGAPLDLTVKPGVDVTLPEGGEILPTGSVRYADAGQVSALPGYDRGDWWVQDAAAAIPARLLQVGPGDTVLDMCAAPGGKTLQLAAAGAHVTALDQSRERLERLFENLERMKLSADTDVADARYYRPKSQVDAVLLDTPCSATGTARRHPDVIWNKTPEAIASLTQIQDALLKNASAMVKPGGKLVYACCSLQPEEGIKRIEAFLRRHKDWRREPVRAGEVPGGAEFITVEGDMRTLPCNWMAAGGIDGFYIARLVKDAASETAVDN
jgi:16S rRNA (cytosine967-C5)-methyltransferase